MLPVRHFGPGGRRGLTLMELLVVIFLMTILITLTAIYIVPAFRDNKNVQRGVDQVALALLTAKQRSLRDQVPRGVRFLVQPDGTCSELQLIELPEGFRVGTATPAPGNQVQFSFPAGTDLYGGAPAASVAEHLVQAGDFFRVEVGTPVNYLITQVVGPNQIQLSRPLNPTFTPTPNWRIVRQPRSLAGEDTVKLPPQVVVDIGHMNSFSSGNYQVSTRPVPGAAPGTLYYEVMFDPAGGVLDRPSSPIVIWVRQSEAAPAAKDPNVNLLLAVYPRTGMIGTHPIDPLGATPLTYALDGRASGM